MDPRLQVPGYSRILDRESLVRDAPFLSLTESIGPFTVRCLTLRDFLALKRHPLLKNENPTVGDLVVFIRFLWSGSRKKPTISNSIAKWLFGRRCFRYVREHYFECLNDCLEYLEETFTDSLGPKSMGWNPSYYSEAVSYVSTFCRHYRWPPDYTLDLPMKLVLQYKRELEHVEGILPVNRSDQLIVEATLAMRRRN